MANHIVVKVTSHRVIPLRPKATRKMTAAKTGDPAIVTRESGVKLSRKIPAFMTGV